MNNKVIHKANLRKIMIREDFEKKAISFLENIFSSLEEEGLSLEDWEIDHLCYRVESLVDYEKKQKEFSSFSKLLIESEIGGRMISTFKLHDPLIYEKRKIQVIELPAPKASRNDKEGFEHIEVVIPMSFDYLISRYNHLVFDMSAINKKHNPELKFKMNHFQVKFHHNSLEKIIEQEKLEK